MASIHFHHASAATLGAEKQGHQQAELLMQAGINPAISIEHYSRVSDWQMTRLVQNLWHLLSDEFMGFTEHKCKPGTFAFMLDCISSNTNLYAALKQGCQFYNLVTSDITTRTTKSANQIAIEFGFSKRELDPDHFFHEFWFVIWHRLACWLTGIQIPLKQVNFSYAKPKHHKELKLMFPCQHKFNQVSNIIIFDASYANAELIRTEAEIKAFLQNSPFDLLTIPGFDLSCSTAVKQCLWQSYQQAKQFANLALVANQLNLSQPTLHRRLKQEGVNFQMLKDELRKDIAIDLLVKQNMPVYEVAEKLGFTDARSLTRSFKKWTGLTPRAYKS